VDQLRRLGRDGDAGKTDDTPEHKEAPNSSFGASDLLVAAMVAGVGFEPTTFGL